MRRSLSIAAGVLVVMGGRAGAQDSSEGARLFEEGRALAEQGKFAEACELYAKSYELERAAGTMLNLGDCAEREGKLGRAWQLFDAAARELERGGKARANRARFARGRADALAPKLATVVVRIAEPRVDDLTVRIGGRAVPAAREIVERLEEGSVKIEVGAAGREPFATTVDGVVGAEVVVEVPALRGMGSEVMGAAGAPPETARPVPTRRQRGRVVIAAGAGVAGALGLGVAAALAASARVEYGDYKDRLAAMGCTVSCDPAAYELAMPYYDRAARRADLATGFVIGGSVLVAAGAVLFLTAPRERVTIAPAAGGVGLAAVGRF